MNTIEKLQSILRQMEGENHLYVEKPETDFTRKRELTFCDLMSFLLFLGANSMEEEIRQAFSHKDFDFINKSFLDYVVEAKNKANERKAAVSLLSKLYCHEKTLAVMDRGYDGLKMIERCNRIKNLYYLIRLRAIKMKEFAVLPDEVIDTDLEFKFRQKRSRQPYELRIKAWDMELPCTVRFRLVKFKIGDGWEVLATNLPQSVFSVQELKKLYKARWKIETAFRYLKNSLASLHFHSKKRFVQSARNFCSHHTL